jgi:hypothetical protein
MSIVHDITVLPSPFGLIKCISFFHARRFVLLLLDPSASIRAHACAMQALINTLNISGASADGDRDSAAVASDWLSRLLNSNSFFTSHPSLILQVLIFFTSI